MTFDNKNIDYSLITTLLKNRGYSDTEIDHVLYAKFLSVRSPNKLHNAESAAKLIKQYCDNNFSYIYIYADYDVDGLTSGYIIKDVLDKKSTGKVELLFPNRSDGYGLNLKTCQDIIDKHKDTNTPVLIITVDNGITCVDQINLLKENNIEALVLDHHESKETVPDCLIVDAHGPDKDESNYHLCGCEVVYKVCQVLTSLYDEYNMMRYLPFVALGILADMMELTEENIALVRYGIDIINTGKTISTGLNQLIDYCGLTNNVYPNDLKFDIIPKLNACGRMNNIQLAYKLLITKDETECDEIINEIVDLNDTRKDLTKSAKQLIKDKIESYPTNWLDQHTFSIILDKKYSGICGIVATQAIQEYELLPIAFAVTETEDNLFIGSIRINDKYVCLDAQEILNQELEKGIISFFGGHKYAAGFAIPLDSKKLETFINDLDSYTINQFSNYDDSCVQQSNDLTYDAEISYDNFSEEFYKTYAFIPLDTDPVFCIKDVYCLSSHCSRNNPLNIEYKFVKNNQIKDIWIWNEKDKKINKTKVNLYGNIVPDFRNRNKYTMKIKNIIKC